MKKNIFEIVEEALKQVPKYVSDDGKLLKTVVYSDVMTMSKELLTLLMANADIKETFFTTVMGGVQVFDKQRFTWFLESKEFLPDSYTRYSNKIGLTNNGNFLSKSNDVVLDFPYKDCVLEGGQDKDDQKRDEIFYHELIASDTINKMLSPKVFTNAKRYSKDGVEENITFNDNDNLIIKGNNLIALSCLLKRFEGKVKCIYIDPPYNTGNDSFNYNDSFNHSTWLTFMKNRLELAKRLLREDGVIFVQCDDNEMPYLSIMMDEIFGRDHQINTICVNMSNASGVKITAAIKGKRFPKIKEYVLLYARNMDKYTLKISKIQKNKWDPEYNLIIPSFTIEHLRAYTEGRLEQGDISNLCICSLKQYMKDHNIADTQEWKQDNAYRIFASKPNSALLNRSNEFEFNTEVALIANASGDKKLIKTDFNRNTKTARIELVSAEINGSTYLGDHWEDIVTTGGVALEGAVSFPKGKKPEKLIHRVIQSCTSIGDIVLDFHLGSGTTAAVAHKMGRQYIGIEQMDYIEDITIERLKKVIEGEQGGISKSLEWKGGGSFVYCKLLKDAYSLIEEVQSATENNVNQIKKRIYADDRIIPYITQEELKKTDEDFSNLTLEEKKKALIALINKNKLYVNYSDMNDVTFNVDNTDKTFTQSFYKEV